MNAPLAACLSAIILFSGLGSSQALEPLSAKDLANRLSALQQDGSSYIRLRMNVDEPPGTKKTALQLQIHQRRTASATDVIYQILWPKERQGESVLLKNSGNQAANGTHFIPPDSRKSLNAQSMKDSLFGSDLAYADLIENFYAWDTQVVVGEEMIGKVKCQILESRPGSGQTSIYTSVRSWVDPDRFVPLRVEKFASSGKPIRRIETIRITKEASGQHIPASMTVQDLQKNSITELEGSRLNSRVDYQDQDFTVNALRDIKKSQPSDKASTE